jgi:hypothetical protein
VREGEERGLRADESEEDHRWSSERASTYDELSRLANLTEEMALIIRYQCQFSDHRFLENLIRQSCGFFKMASDCLELERVTNSSRTSYPSTWTSCSASTMFLRTRPPHTDHELEAATETY